MTEAEFQKWMIQAMSGVYNEVSNMRRAVDRLEGAVLGAPENGVDGLMSRMLVTEARVEEIRALTPSKKKNLAITSVAGVVGSILTLLAALAKDMG